jgi:hypothetical protein
LTADITLDELLAEYRRLGLGREDEGLTTLEYGERWKLASNAVLRRLKLAARAGMLRAGRKTVSRVDGVPTLVPCYTIELPAAGRPGKARKKK